MAETALTFGPDWIRAYSAGAAAAATNAANPPTVMPIPKYSLAEYRYGREEMLALIPKVIKIPTCLKDFPHLTREQFQMPLALIPVTEEEQRLWTRVNSDAALRASGNTRGGMGRTGRGGSVDRGRGRGRGGYYQRGLMHEDDDGLHSFSRPKQVERSLSANERDLRWDDRDRRYDRPYSGRSGGDDGFLKQDNVRAPHEYWRKYDKDDDGDWRSSGSRSSDRIGGRGSWRNNSERDRQGPLDRNLHNRNVNPNSRSGPSPHKNHSWKEPPSSHLPEWSVEETNETDTVGTFDSSGAFLETKTSEDASLDEIYLSDSADEGSSKENPEADKKTLKKLPKSSPNNLNNKSSSKKKVDNTSKEEKTPQMKPAQNSPSELSKNNSKNSKTGISKSASDVIRTKSDAQLQQQLRLEPESKFIPDLNTNVPDVNSKCNKVEDSVVFSNLRNSDNITPTSGTAEEDAFAHHKKATENMVAQWTEEEEQQAISHTVDIHPPHEKETKWFYQDPQGDIQGPFKSSEMLEWFSAGYFTEDLMVQRNYDETFSKLGDLIKAWDRVPFLPGNLPPPIRATPLASSVPTPITQTSVPNPSATPAPSQLPKQDDLLTLQRHMYQQQLMQQQLIMRQQAQMQAILSQLKQQDKFSSLSSQQQQQVLMQQFMSQQQMARPNVNPLTDQPPMLDPLSTLPLPLLGLSMPPMMGDMNLWNTAGSGAWPMNLSTPQPPGASIWDINPKSEDSESGKIKTEEHEKMRKAEELRQEHERELEEKRRQEEIKRQQEEAKLLQELQKQEEEKRRLEELKRQQEEERRRQEELRILEEKKRQEELKRLEELRIQEEMRKQEELRRLEELRKQEELRRQEELRKQEELRRLEELQKQEEQRQMEELRRKEEQRIQEEIRKQQEKKQEEKRKRDEALKEEKKKQIEKEQEKLLEIERQKEALRLKEIEREERYLAEKREREELELMKLAELKLRSQGPVWGIQNAQSTNELSLADIQRLQEEKEREERQEKLRQQSLTQQTVKQVQNNKSSLSWAKRAIDSQPVVKSLYEIQQEEAERLAQLQRTVKPQPPPPTLSTNAGVWGNTSHLNKITAAPQTWNTSNVSSSNVSSTTGFWDDVISNNSHSRKQPQKTSETSAFPALANRGQPATVNNKNKNVRAKKEEDAVTRLFGSHHKPTDEFTKWCTDALSSMPSSVDVPTFVAFLKDIESPYEVYDYVKSYLGEGKEPREFAKQFIEKRSKYRNQTKQTPAEENTLWGPAPAITPTVNKTPVQNSNDCDGNSNAKGKAKKKKNRMQKLDNSMLGFTVQSNPDRVNVGEIDHIDGV